MEAIWSRRTGSRASGSGRWWEGWAGRRSLELSLAYTLWLTLAQSLGLMLECTTTAAQWRRRCTPTADTQMNDDGRADRRARQWGRAACLGTTGRRGSQAAVKAGFAWVGQRHGQIFAGCNRTESGDDRAINVTRVTLVGSVEIVVEVLGILVRCQERDNSMTHEQTQAQRGPRR